MHTAAGQITNYLRNYLHGRRVANLLFTRQIKKYFVTVKIRTLTIYKDHFGIFLGKILVICMTFHNIIHNEQATIV